jgi:hypothetical protein
VSELGAKWRGLAGEKRVEIDNKWAKINLKNDTVITKFVKYPLQKTDYSYVFGADFPTVNRRKLTK